MSKLLEEEKAQASIPDFDELSRNMAVLNEKAGKATAAYLKPMEERQVKPGLAGEAEDAVKALGHVAETWMTDPQKALEAQSRLGSQFIDLWASTLKRAQGEPVKPVAEPEPKDSRF